MDGTLEIFLTLGDETCDFWEKMSGQRLIPKHSSSMACGVHVGTQFGH